MVEVEVQAQDVHALLAEDAEHRTLRVSVDEGQDLTHFDPACRRHAMAGSVSDVVAVGPHDRRTTVVPGAGP